MDTASPLFLALDLTGVFAFALNAALTAIRVARLDVVGVVTLGMVTALGGGIIRDVFLDSLPPATFSDWRYLVVAAVGSLVTFTFGRRLDRWMNPIFVLDAAGLVSGALKAASCTRSCPGGSACADRRCRTRRLRHRGGRGRCRAVLRDPAAGYPLRREGSIASRH